MFEKVDHIGVAVKDLNEAIKFYVDTLGGIKETPIFGSPRGDRSMVMISLGNVKFEFVSTTDTESALAKFIEEYGEGLHHLGVEVDDIDKEIKSLTARGVSAMDNQAIQRPNHKAAYIYPEAMNGVSVEMMEFLKKEYVY